MEGVTKGQEQVMDIQTSPLEIKKRLDQGDSIFLLDVREPQEYAFARIEGAHLIPLGELPYRYQELDAEKEILVYCHHGIRSLQAANFLLQMGFKNVKNLSGGIDAWSLQSDLQVPRYG